MNHVNPRHQSIGYHGPLAGAALARNLSRQLLNLWPSTMPPQQLACLCIGSDAINGDALGPFVGSFLSHTVHPCLRVFGTLHRPVHAQNLAKVATQVQSGADTLVLAIDACLGREDQIGEVLVNPGALRPGRGVGKALPAIGDLHILGIVGASAQPNALQETRLHLVTRMAEIIGHGILLALQSIHQPKADPHASARRLPKAFPRLLREPACLS